MSSACDAKGLSTRWAPSASSRVDSFFYGEIAMKRIIAAITVCLLFLGCVSTPSQAQKAPEWVLDTPDPDATYTYFVGDSSDTSGDQTKATEQAVGVIISNIVKYMGVKINAEFVGDTQATLDSYAANMKQKITETSQARIVGFTVTEKFISRPKDKGSKTINAYVLAKYETKELNKERDRIRKLIEEQENMVLVPEKAGNDALAAGRYADAVQSFLQAAAGAASVDVDNKEIKVERNLNSARNALLPLRLIRVSAPVGIGLGQDPAEPFVIKLVKGENDNGPGVPGAKLAASYQRKMASGRLTNKTEDLASDAKGLASIKPPAYDYVGASKVAFSLNMGSAMDLLDRIPAKYESLKDSVRREISSKYVEFEFKIGSDAKNIPLQVVVLDFDEAGSAQGSLAQGAIIDGFLKEKFKATAANAAKAAVQGGDEAAILTQAKALGAKRLVYGSARLESVKKDGGAFVVSCRVSLSVLDVDSGTVISVSEKSVNAIGTSESEARANAYRDSGRTAAKDLMAKL